VLVGDELLDQYAMGIFPDKMSMIPLGTTTTVPYHDLMLKFDDINHPTHWEDPLSSTVSPAWLRWTDEISLLTARFFSPDTSLRPIAAITSIATLATLATGQVLRDPPIAYLETSDIDKAKTTHGVFNTYTTTAAGRYQ
jgi:hypothetical protein